MSRRPTDLQELPGGDLVAKGLRDLASGHETIESLLVSIGAPRLRALDVQIPDDPIEQPEHGLYERLATENADAAHSRYNALLRLVVGFERALACAA